MNTLEEDLIEIIDLLNFTFSSSFTEKWSFKYGRRLPKLLQMRLLKCLDSRKPLKLQALHKFLVVDSGFSPEVIENFLLDIDYEIYSPIISGRLNQINQTY